MFLIFGLINFLQIYINNKTINSLEIQKQNIVSKYNMLPSIVQNRSVIKRYSHFDTDYKKFTNLLYYVLSYKKELHKGKIVSTIYKNKILSVEFTKIDTSSIVQYIKKQYKNIKIIQKTPTVKLEIRYD